MTVVYTIGYEGTDLAQFVNTLVAAGIEILADVRAVPISRKKGFSKTRLSAALTRAGIEYVHFVDLGNPKNGRTAAKAGQKDVFHRIFRAHLKSSSARTALKKLDEIASINVVCLMCFERDPVECHRTLIASELNHYGMKRIDLYADSPDCHGRSNNDVPRRYLSQGVAAAE